MTRSFDGIEMAASTDESQLSRRNVTQGLAWSVPAISAVSVLGSAAPAVAASGCQCPPETCYDVVLDAGTATVAGVPGVNTTDVTMVGGAITFTCSSKYGWLGGWTLWADSYTTSFTDHADITTPSGLTATTPSALGSCRFQACYATSRVGTWNTIGLTRVSGPTPLP